MKEKERGKADGEQKTKEHLFLVCPPPCRQISLQINNELI